MHHYILVSIPLTLTCHLTTIVLVNYCPQPANISPSVCPHLLFVDLRFLSVNHYLQAITLIFWSDTIFEPSPSYYITCHHLRSAKSLTIMLLVRHLLPLFYDNQSFTTFWLSQSSSSISLSLYFTCFSYHRLQSAGCLPSRSLSPSSGCQFYITLSVCHYPLSDRLLRSSAGQVIVVLSVTVTISGMSESISLYEFVTTYPSSIIFRLYAANSFCCSICLLPVASAIWAPSTC